jgi:hypothetical protein
VPHVAKYRGEKGSSKPWQRPLAVYVKAGRLGFDEYDFLLQFCYTPFWQTDSSNQNEITLSYNKNNKKVNDFLGGDALFVRSMSRLFCVVRAPIYSQRLHSAA